MINRRIIRLTFDATLKKKDYEETQNKTDLNVSEMQQEYRFDYKNGKPNRFVETVQHLTVQIDEDVTDVFSSAEKVNSALCAIITAYSIRTRKTNTESKL
ncbi:MAG: hypothetical protein AB1394_00085 [Bacteroidota bacterium]